MVSGEHFYVKIRILFFSFKIQGNHLFPQNHEVNDIFLFLKIKSSFDDDGTASIQYFPSAEYPWNFEKE